MIDVCFFHSNCADGWASSWLCKRAFPDCVLVPVNHGEPMPDLETIRGKNLLIADFSYPPEDMVRIAGVTETVVVLDHHISAIEKWRGQQIIPVLDGMASWGDNVRMAFDVTKSGAMLTWEWLLGEVAREKPDGFFFDYDEGDARDRRMMDPPWLVRYVQDRDLWKLPDSQAVNAYVRCRPMTVENWDDLYERLEDWDGRREAVTAGRAILARERQTVDRCVKAAVMKRVAGFVVPVVNTAEMISEVGHALCEGHPFSVSYYDDLKAGVRRWSLRSRDGGEDVSRIAGQFGGGGHAHASVCETDLKFMFEGV